MSGILILEDEAMIQMMVEDYILDAGLEVAGTAYDVEEALEFLDNCDGAILDVNLGNGATSYPIADRLTELGKPFVFMTGNHTSCLNERYKHIETLQKPAQRHNIIAAVQNLLAPRIAQAA